jgi:hypothetical protein
MSPGDMIAIVGFIDVPPGWLRAAAYPDRLRLARRAGKQRSAASI